MSFHSAYFIFLSYYATPRPKFWISNVCHVTFDPIQDTNLENRLSLNIIKHWNSKKKTSAFPLPPEKKIKRKIIFSWKQFLMKKKNWNFEKKNWKKKCWKNFWKKNFEKKILKHNFENIFLKKKIWKKILQKEIWKKNLKKKFWKKN